MTSFVEKNARKKYCWNIVTFDLLAYFPPITLLPLLHLHTGVCEETFIVNSKIAQTTQF